MLLVSLALSDFCLQKLDLLCDFILLILVGVRRIGCFGCAEFCCAWLGCADDLTERIDARKFLDCFFNVGRGDHGPLSDQEFSEQLDLTFGELLMQSSAKGSSIRRSRLEDSVGQLLDFGAHLVGIPNSLFFEGVNLYK
jgi:hypothetical protein